MFCSDVFLKDCVEGMRDYPDKFFDLAVVDPPYGIGYSQKAAKSGGTKYGVAFAKKKEYSYKEWDASAPDVDYFKELFRISKNQVIWGANHFIEKIPINSSCWLVWDKDNGNTHFADCELAWTSFPRAVRKFKFRWNGMLQEDMKNKETRIHPTQKPVKLYDWVFKLFAKPGDKVIDTHMGSQNSRISAYKAGLFYHGYEIDEEYFEDGKINFSKAVGPL